MIQLNRILVPVDFSEFSRHALRYGCALAEKFGAELHLLHVVEPYYPPVPEAGFMLGERDEYLSALKAAAERELTGLPGASQAQGIRMVRSVVAGPPFVEIVRYAREHAMDLIVVGSHGRSGLAHVLMGSVAERVVRKAGCPVLTVRPGQHEFVMP
jgi:nucleotide-binding universal stress UspA family protein